jgi:uncharacterized protein
MSKLPSHADLDQLRRQAKERLRAARAGDPAHVRWFDELGLELQLSSAQLAIAREYGFASWAAMHLEVARRRVLDLRDAAALAAFIDQHRALAMADLVNWRDHPAGASPLGYVAMMRYDTTARLWRDVPGTGAMAHVLVAAGAPVDGIAGDRETPLITAASYGDGDVAAVLIGAGADIDALARADSGGVPGGSALLHAAVFGMTAVMDLLVAAGAKVRSLEEAAAAGDVSQWSIADTDEQTRIRALVMASHHERVEVIGELIAVGTAFDVADEVFGRHPLRLAASDGRPASVRFLLDHGANRELRDSRGLTALDHCRHGRATFADTSGHDEVQALLTA